MKDRLCQRQHVVKDDGDASKGEKHGEHLRRGVCRGQVTVAHG